jgi:hypothetical protein
MSRPHSRRALRALRAVVPPPEDTGKIQDALLRVTWVGHDIAAIYKPEQNLGVAGVRAGPFYADIDPITKHVYMSWRGSMFPFKLHLWPKQMEVKIETELHVIKAGLFRRFRVY